MTKKHFTVYVILFSSLVILANYTVQFQINDWLTYGAVMFPFTFLLTDILSERYGKDETLKVIKYGVLVAIVPTILISDWRIALASLTCLIISQHFNVRIFVFLKSKFPSLWWLRSNGSTLIAQFFDTAIFFTLAFAFTMPPDVIVKLILGDYMTKITIALLDTPLFYLLAIRLRHFSFRKI